jgi:hypothetical protein
MIATNKPARQKAIIGAPAIATEPKMAKRKMIINMVIAATIQITVAFALEAAGSR